jgi:hypothetical protein
MTTHGTPPGDILDQADEIIHDETQRALDDDLRRLGAAPALIGDCVCGHHRDSHQHLRAGTDCAFRQDCFCHQYHRRREGNVFAGILMALIIEFGAAVGGWTLWGWWR